MRISGKTESFTGTVTDKFRELQPVLQNITKTMHDFSKNTSMLLKRMNEAKTEVISQDC